MARRLKPGVMLRRKAMRSGVLGGDRKWRNVFIAMFLWKRVKALFGFGDPQPVYVEDVEPGQRFVVAHEESTSRRKRRKARKADKKMAKKATKKAAKSTAKVAAKAAKKAAKNAVEN